jgi:periplasmic protein TonB
VTVDVSDVLRDRMSAPTGLQGMVVVSLALHAALFGGMLFLPRTWLGAQPTVPKTVMTISLAGGNGGPNNGGMTSIGGRAVQAEPPPEPPKRPEPVRPPAAKTEEAVVPIPTKTPPPRPARPAPPRPATPIKEAPPEARGRTPTRGPETRAGSAIAETGARGLGFGLSTSGVTGTGSTLDVSDFCCPEYIALMVEKIRTNWNARAGVSGSTIIKYTIQRDGTITNPEIVKRSGYNDLDLNALRAVVGTRQFLPLPGQFSNQTLTVNLSFEYTR